MDLGRFFVGEPRMDSSRCSTTMDVRHSSFFISFVWFLILLLQGRLSYNVFYRLQDDTYILKYSIDQASFKAS